MRPTYYNMLLKTINIWLICNISSVYLVAILWILNWVYSILFRLACLGVLLIEICRLRCTIMELTGPVEMAAVSRIYFRHRSYIQYWSVDGKYRIYLTRLRNGVKDELLASLSPRFAPSQINSIFTVNRPILYLSCNPRCPKK